MPDLRVTLPIHHFQVNQIVFRHLKPSNRISHYLVTQTHSSSIRLSRVDHEGHLLNAERVVSGAELNAFTLDPLATHYWQQNNHRPLSFQPHFQIGSAPCRIR